MQIWIAHKAMMTVIVLVLHLNNSRTLARNPLNLFIFHHFHL